MAKSKLKDLLATVTKPVEKKAEVVVRKEVKHNGRALTKVAGHGKVVNYYVEYEDGTVHLAQGAHADLVYRFTLEAQQLVSMNGFAYYEGPSMTEITKEEALRKLVFEETNAK